MRRLTPTAWGERGGRPRVELLGSTEAVLARLTEAAENPLGRPQFILVAHGRVEPVRCLISRRGAAATIVVVSTYTCPPRLWDFPPGAVAGVDVNAWAGIPGAQWAETQRLLQSRFATVFWG